MALWTTAAIQHDIPFLGTSDIEAFLVGRLQEESESEDSE